MKSSISNIDNENTGARGDCLYQSVNSILNSTNAKNIPFDFEYPTDQYFQSNLTRGEQEQNQVCFPTSSTTFIVSSSPLPSEITIEQSINNISHLNTNMNLFASRKECDHQHRWFKEHWISFTILAGIIVIFMIIIITILIH